MIERPKRAVTRFFIPLIDVLILLFCIFLLLPFTNQPSSADPAGKSAEDKKDLTPEQMKTEIASLNLQLARALKENDELMKERTNPAARVMPFMLEIEPKEGHLYYYSGGDSKRVANQRDALAVIDLHKRQSGIAKDPLFIIMLPRELKGPPSPQQLKEYDGWFKDVPHQFNDPFVRIAK